MIRIISKPTEHFNSTKFLPNTENDLQQITLRKIAKLKNTRQKNIYLRVFNNDIFSKEKLHKFGIVESPNCSRCGCIETKLHLIFECPQVRSIWNKICSITKNKQLAEVKDAFGISNNNTILKIKTEFIGLLINKNRPFLHTIQTIEGILNKLISIENRNRTLVSICNKIKIELGNNPL